MCFETRFTISEEYLSFSPDDFEIIDANTGQVAFLVSGKVASLRETKTLHNANDSAPIWAMKKNILNVVGRSYQFTHPVTNVPLFTIKNHRRWFANQGKKLSITLGNGSVVTMETSQMDKTAVVTITMGTTILPIAKVQRPLHSARNVVANVQDYQVTIAPNVDIPLILGLVIALDEEGERLDNKKQRMGGGVMLPGSAAAQQHGLHSQHAAGTPTYVTPKYSHYSH